MPSLIWILYRQKKKEKECIVKNISGLTEKIGMNMVD